MPGTSNLIEAGDEVTYTTVIKNPSQKERNDVVITNKLPEGLEYKDAYILSNIKTRDGVIYNQTTNTVTFNIGKLGAKDELRVVLVGNIKPLANNEEERQIKNSVQMKCAQASEVFNSNEVTHYQGKPKLKVTHTSNKPEGRDRILYYY